MARIPQHRKTARIGRCGVGKIKRQNPPNMRVSGRNGPLTGGQVVVGSNPAAPTKHAGFRVSGRIRYPTFPELSHSGPVARILPSEIGEFWAVYAFLTLARKVALPRSIGPPPDSFWTRTDTVSAALAHAVIVMD
jgi:hypothetical protein